jgi:undecaprenyl-diphosphatase
VTDIDVQIFRFLHHAFSGGWILPMAALSAIGGGWGALAILPLYASPRNRRMAIALAYVVTVTAVVVFALKRAFARVRPCGCLADIHALVFDAPSDFSFPSGHAAGSFAFCVFLALVIVKTAPDEANRRERVRRWLVSSLLILLAAGVGLSRIALGVHFPGDVLAGAALGTMAAIAGAVLHVRGAAS